MSLPTGTRIGPYGVLAQIARAAWGRCIGATDTNLKRQVALKVLPASLAGDSDRLARFPREAEVLASLNPPNIAAIHGLEEWTVGGGNRGGRRALVRGTEPPRADEVRSQGTRAYT